MGLRDEIKQLLKLRIQEVSGVDDPANEIPGFMVVKSAQPEAPSPELVAAIENVRKAEADCWEDIRRAMGTKAFCKFVLEADPEQLDVLAVAATLGGMIEEAERATAKATAPAPAPLLPWKHSA